MKRLVLLLALASAAFAQLGPPERVRFVSVAPTVGAACNTPQSMQRSIAADATSGHLYSCQAGVWADITGTGAASGYTTIQDEGTGLTARTKLNFIGSLVTCADDAGNTRTNCTFSGSSSPFTASGSFDNTAMTLPLQGLINSADIQTDYQKGQSVSNFAAIGVAGSTVVPSTSTLHEADGVFGSCTGNNATTNCVGGAFYAFAATNGTDGTSDANRNRLWGFNTLMGDKAKSHIFMTNEMDFNVTGTDTKVIGWQVTGASTQALTSDSVGISLGPVGSGIGWPVGFYCAQGSITATGLCLKIDPTSSSNNVSSNKIEMLSRSSGGTLNTADIFSGPAGGITFSLSSGAGFTFQNNAGTIEFQIDGGGRILLATLTNATLGTPANGALVYCSDCTVNSTTCAASGTGAIAKRVNGAWRCD